MSEERQGSGDGRTERDEGVDGPEPAGEDSRDDGRGDSRDDGASATDRPVRGGRGAGGVVMPDVDDGLDEESYQRLHGQRLRRLWRQRVVFGVVVLLVLCVGGGAALIWTGRWDPGASPTSPTAAPTPSCTPAPEQPLLTPAEVSVEVLNGTSRRGLAATVANELRTRGFVVTRVDNAPTAAGPVTANVRFPPAAEQQARTVAARIPDVQMFADPAATLVEVSLGDAYAALLAEDALVAPARAAPVC